MARIFIDGFESGNHDLWDAELNATVVGVGSTGFNGAYMLDIYASIEFLEKNITAVDEMYFAFLYRYAGQMFSVYAGTTVLINIARSAVSLPIAAYLGSGQGTRLGIGSTALFSGTIYLIEVHIKIADSGGRVEVKVDGKVEVDYTGDTKVGADTQFNRVRLGYSGSMACTGYFDNFIMDDANWIGNTNIQAVVPTGAGTVTEWTPSAGANYACVDEKPPSDVDYVSTNTVDLTDTYATGDLAGTISSVKCVQVQARTLYDGAPTPTNIKLVVKSGVTNYLSGDKLVPLTARGFSHLWELNPADAAAWERADVNAMEIGVKSAA